MTLDLLGISIRLISYSGSVDEDDIERDRDWSDYWRLLFPKVDLDAIKDFAAKYKGSRAYKSLDVYL